MAFCRDIPSHEKNPDPWDILKVKNPGDKNPGTQKIPNPGDKNSVTEKIPNPGDFPKIPKKSRIPGIFQKSRKNPDAQKIVKTQKFSI